MQHTQNNEPTTDHTKEQAALLLRLQGNTHRSIAKHQGVSHPTAMKWVSVAKARLEGFAEASGIHIDWDDPQAALAALGVMAASSAANPFQEEPPQPVPPPPAPSVEPAPTSTPDPPEEPSTQYTEQYYAEDPFSDVEASAAPPSEPEAVQTPDVAAREVAPTQKPPAPPKPEFVQTPSGVSPDNPWPMGHGEMDYLANNHKASHYEPETWPYWAKRLDVGIGTDALRKMESMYPEKGQREAIYGDIWKAIHTGDGSAWKWVGLNLTLILKQHELFVWCQMLEDGKTIEIKFVQPHGG
ncbi:hypothetical protein ABT282_08080 [Streptomyces sp. NPDC000927]|uniref:helix-turn-helix domain-containing protein n=1 Tax=Streptomyces sp. NPDC000927 TaxID=3154371 RepID=UPI003316652A